MSENELVIRVDDAVAAAFPDYRALVVVARGVVNRSSTELSARLLAGAAERARTALAGRAPSELPEMAAWRAAFSRFGAKPSRFPSSAEALLKRAARGEVPPAINLLVDCYNETLTPAGRPELEAAARELEANLRSVGAGGELERILLGPPQRAGHDTTSPDPGSARRLTFGAAEPCPRRPLVRASAGDDPPQYAGRPWN